jgi:hypothetical protein
LQNFHCQQYIDGNGQACMNPLKDSRPRRGRLRRLCVEQIPKDIRLLLAGDHTGWGRTHAKTFAHLGK